MIIGACGYAATGSGAVFDFLKEFDELQVGNDAEFKYTYKIDGLQDLHFHLLEKYSKTSSGDAAILRFKKASNFFKVPFLMKPIPWYEYKKITDKYVNSIVQSDFIGIENYDYENCSYLKSIITLGIKKIVAKYYEIITGKPYNFWPFRKIYICVEPEEFIEKSKQYIRDIIKAMGFDLSKPIVLNQPFEGNCPENSFPYFDNPKAIIIDRDVRDVYAAHQKVYFGEGRHMPRQNVKAFVEQYKQVRIHQPKINTEQKLYIQFEDFILRYEEVSKQIMQFLDLKEHSHPKKFFNPSRSINNIQIYRKYPDLEKDIKILERELPEYCFDFSNLKIKHTGKSF